MLSFQIKKKKNPQALKSEIRKGKNVAMGKWSPVGLPASIVWKPKSTWIVVKNHREKILGAPKSARQVINHAS